MKSPANLTFGTDTPDSKVSRYDIGALGFLVQDGALRQISWHGVEVLRGIACLVRDTDWGTYPAEDERVRVDASTGFSLDRRYSIANGALAVHLTVSAQAEGTLSAKVALTATRDFQTNRAGFTILHPIVGVAGQPLTVTHPDRSATNTEFPDRILPSQPVFDAVALSHTINGIGVDIRFEGDIFEMEDQRNWTDASFKTYCRPLRLPRPFVIRSGETVHQAVHLTMSGTPKGRTTATPIQVTGCVPEMLLAVEPEWIGGTARLPEARMVLRLGTGTDWNAATFGRIAAMTNKPVDLEIALPEGSATTPYLRALAGQIADAGLTVGHAMALPHPYLKSRQPTDPAFKGPTPEECLLPLAAAFPQAKIGIGMLTNFTEVNRHRPVPDLGQYVTHGTTAIVHAADDTSVFETIEALPHVFASAKALCGARDYRLSLVSIGMRSNPYGAGVAANPDLSRLPMAQIDPRQSGLFAAAFAIGAASASAFAGAQAIALAAPAGPFGLVSERGGATVYRPVFHAVRALAELAGQRAESLTGLPAAICGLKIGRRIILANCATTSVEVALGVAGMCHILDATTAAAASRDPDWLHHSPARPNGPLTLGPCACLFATIGDPL